MENKNWRLKIGKKKQIDELDWRIYLQEEFVEFADEAERLAGIYDWDFWGGGVGNYAITLSQPIRNGKAISICMQPIDNYKYYVSFAKETNPNNVDKASYCECVGNDMNEALKYIHTYLMENKYVRDNRLSRICVMGGAYERYPLAKKWAYEALEENKRNRDKVAL